MQMPKNIITNTDSYKFSQYRLIKDGTQQMSYYIAARGGKYPYTVFNGLQPFIMEYLMEPVTMAMIDEAEDIALSKGQPFNREGWEYILNELDGYLPLEIKAVKEGTVVPVGNVVAQVTNTDDNCAWLDIETPLLRAIWYASTVATKSRRIKQVLRRFLKETADDLSALPFMLQDFGARSATSNESAIYGGLGLLINFKGSDTVEAVRAARYYYDMKGAAGFSVPASQHSVVGLWGNENEAEFYSYLIDQFDGEGKIFASVSDNVDLFNAIKNIYGGTLKDKIMNIKGQLVIRPDSGDPVEVSTSVIQMLMDIFGYTVNKKGYKVLPRFLRVIQGDGVNENSLVAILTKLKDMKISVENIVFGMGTELLQNVNRDVQSYAMKANAARINDVWVDIAKAPKTDMRKASKPGVLELVAVEGELATVRTEEVLANQVRLLEPVFRNGQLLRKQQFEDIRAIAEVSDNEDITYPMVA